MDRCSITLGKTEWAKINVNSDSDIILCGTDLAYDDLFCGFCYEALEKFGYDTDDCLDNGTLPKLRDAFIAEFENIMNVKFVNVYNTY